MQSTQFNENFTKYLRQKDSEEKESHESSGKISPSKLTKPTLEAVLSLLGVKADEASDQGLRYFLRGNILEEVAIKGITSGWETYEMQVKAEYRNGIGYIDLWNNLPHEIKSAGHTTWKTVQKRGQPLDSHCIQATYYSLATQTDQAWIHYINSDTLMVVSHRIEADTYKNEVDQRINNILDCFRAGNLPDYEPLEPIHKTIRFSNYAMFFNKKGAEAEAILEQLNPELLALLKSGEIYERIKG